MREHLAAKGWVLEDNWRSADFIVFNACGRTPRSAKQSLEIVGQIQQGKTGDQTLVVLGCLPKINGVALRALYEKPKLTESDEDTVQQLASLSHSLEQKGPNHLKSDMTINPKRSVAKRFLDDVVLYWDNFLESRINLFRKKDSDIFYIKVENGCNGNCSYCSIRKSRGPARSKPADVIMDEFRDGLNQGFKKFSLMGTDIGAYGFDLGLSLTDLLKQILKIEGDFTIRLRNVNPSYLKEMKNDLAALLKTGKISYIESAAESGSNRILKLMNRSYTIEEYKDCIKTIKQTDPGIVVRTQLIVGFPTETKEDFNRSLQLIDELNFDYVEVYRYNGYGETPSETIEGKIPSGTIRQRYIRLRLKTIFNRTPSRIWKALAGRMTVR